MGANDPQHANDTTTTLNPGTGGDVMDESQVTQSDGATQAKRPRVVVGSDDGDLYDQYNPMPVQDRAARQMAERAVLAQQDMLEVQIQQRQRERMRWGDRLDLVDRRGPGGR